MDQSIQVHNWVVFGTLIISKSKFYDTFFKLRQLLLGVINQVSKWETTLLLVIVHPDFLYKLLDLFPFLFHQSPQLLPIDIIHLYFVSISHDKGHVAVNEVLRILEFFFQLIAPFNNQPQYWGIGNVHIHVPDGITAIFWHIFRYFPANHKIWIFFHCILVLLLWNEVRAVGIVFQVSIIFQCINNEVSGGYL